MSRISDFITVRIVRAIAGTPSISADLQGDKLPSAARPTSAKGIYVAWTNYQRRIESMQNYFGYDVYYVSSKHLALPYKTISYMFRAKRTIQILLNERPEVVWLQLPPTFLVHLLVLYRFVTRRPFAIIADCHNASLQPPWKTVPLNAFFLNRADLVLVHNQHVAPAARHLGVDGRRLRVLEDCVPVLPSMEGEDTRPSKPIIVMPCSFHADEPIGAVLQAARQFESATFVMTGDHDRFKDRGLLKDLPGNVVVPGFLPTQEFDRLLLRASAILCLTMRDGIQLSAASEAIAAGKPMIVSDTKLLRSLFGSAGIFIDNGVASILQGCRTAIEHGEQYAAAARNMRPRRMERWLADAEPIRLWLASSRVGHDPDAA